MYIHPLFRTMRLSLVFSVLALFALTSFGCGGGGGGGTSGTTNTTGTPTANNSTSISLTPGGKDTFSAPSSTVGPAGVTWSIQEGAAGGSITPAGVYTAPTTPGTYHVIGTSKSDPNVTIIIIVIVIEIGQQSTPIYITPPGASLPPGGTQTFTAAGSSVGSAGVTWSIQEGATGGTITASGLYTAPATAGAYHVTATSNADPTKSATVTVNVHVVVTVSPTSATLSIGENKAFAASVAGTSNQSVTWSVAEGANGGSVDQTGLYTAALQPGTYHVVATSQADTHQSGSATIVVPSGSSSGTIN